MAEDLLHTQFHRGSIGTLLVAGELDVSSAPVFGTRGKMWDWVLASFR